MANRQARSTAPGTNNGGRADAPSARRVSSAAKLLSGHPDDVIRVLDHLDGDDLANVAEAARQLQRERAVARGDLDAIIAAAFESGFGSDGLGLLPWIEAVGPGVPGGSVIVCPGGLVSKSRTNHRCRFVSVDDTWIWESTELIREDKRSTPGRDDGFQAVALLPVVTGMELDVVSGKARRGMHSVDRVVSYEIRGGELVEVSQRAVSPSGMQ